MVSITENYTFLHIQPFLTKKIFMSLIFRDLSFQIDCGNPPDKLILLTFCHNVAKR